MRHHELLQEILGEQQKVQVLSQKVESQVSELRKNQLERSQFLESKLSETLKSQFESQSKHNDEQNETQLSLIMSMDKLHDKLERQYHKLERQCELNEQHADRLQDIQAPLHEMKQAIDVLMPQKDASESDENVVINSFDDFEDLEFAQKNKELLLEHYISERLKPCMGSTIFVCDIYRDVATYGYNLSYKSFTSQFDSIVDQKKIDEKEWSDVFKKVSQHDMAAVGGCKRGGAALIRATYENLSFKDLDTQVEQYISANLKPCLGKTLFSSDIYTHAQNVEKNTFGSQSFRAFAGHLKKGVKQKKADDEEWSIVLHDPKFRIHMGSMDTCRSVYNNLTFKNPVSDSPTALPTAAMEEEAGPSSSQTEQQTPKKRKEREGPEADSEASKRVRI